MSIVRINAITVPEGAGEELHKRFENRVKEVETMEGFESFELLRPKATLGMCIHAGSLKKHLLLGLVLPLSLEDMLKLVNNLLHMVPSCFLSTWY